ncbi:MAG: redoxin domain-containing protein [Bdellovibrionaceae bacterium]|nr:redoxin domain-containing protein [Bdellovibrionales bacterium]MCB9254536.1 redoxin domain-containing protein [Pseudobdellovibrionaceae bacterium]
MRLVYPLVIGLLLLAFGRAQAQEEIAPAIKAGEKPAAVELAGFDEEKKEIEKEAVAAVVGEKKKYTIVELFQTYCYACRQNIALHLTGLIEKTGDVATYKLIAIRNPNVTPRNEFKREVQDFFSQAPADLIPDASDEQKTRIAKVLPKVRVLMDSDRKAMRAFKVQYTPTLYVLDSEGKVVYGHVGSLEGQEDAKKAILKAVGK